MKSWLQATESSTHLAPRQKNDPITFLSRSTDLELTIENATHGQNLYFRSVILKIND